MVNINPMEQFKTLNLQVNIKSACNLRCSYCALPEHSKNQYSTDDTEILVNTDKLITKCDKEGYRIGYFGLFGGEPTLVSPDILGKVLHKIGTTFPGVPLMIQTNGTLVNEEYINKVLEETKDVPFSIGFSMDACKKLHDKYRSKSFDTALTNMLWIKHNTTIRVFTVPTVGPEHMKYQNEMAEWVQLMRDNDIPTHFSYIGGDLGISDPEFYIWFTNFLIKNNLLSEAIKLLGKNWCYRSGCNKMLLDLTDGDIFQCENTFDKNNPISNWITKSFNEVLGERQCIVDTFPSDFDECLTCEYKDFCNGGCPIYRFKDGKPSDCEAIKRLLGYVKSQGINWTDL